MIKFSKIAFIILAIFFGFFIFVDQSQAADKYVRKGASGSGTSWSDAYGDLNNVSWSGMANGDTLWIAAGSYAGSMPTIGTNGITIKRATAVSHGVAGGWSDAFDGQVTVDAKGKFLWISADNIMVDGGSHNPWKFKVVGVRAYNGMVQIGSGSDSVTIRNIEFDGQSENDPAANGKEDGFRVEGGNNLTIEYCFIHDYRYVGDEHSDAVQMPSGTNFIFRYNISANNGMHLFLGDVDWFGSSGWVDNIKIYYNVFYNESGIVSGAYSGSYNTIVCKNCNRSSSYYMYIENNTFALRSSEVGGGYRNILIYQNGSNSDQLFFRNNIAYYSELGSATAGSHSHNSYFGVSALSETGRTTSDPLFTSYSANNFTLQSSSPVRASGISLGYTQDIVGTAIPQNPGLGAYQYVSGTTSPPTAKKGDLNSDSKVDIIDLGIFLSNWGATTRPASDLNQDGKVDIIDLGILLSNWG